MRVKLLLLLLIGLSNISNAQIIHEKAACSNPIPIQFTVTVTSNYNGQAISCNGNCDGEITVTVTGGGGGPYGFQMYDGDFTITQSANSPGGGSVATFTGLCADNFNFTVIDTAQVIFGTIYESCTEFGVIITDPNNIGVNVLGFQDPTCPDSCDGRIFANIGGGTAPLSILWLESGSTQASPTGVCTGVNTVQVTDANGCFFTQTVTVDDPSQIDFGINIQDVSCDGICDAQITSTPSGSNGGPFNFTWTQVSNNTTIGAATAVPSHTIGGLCETLFYELDLEDVNGCPFDTVIQVPDVLPMTLTQTSSLNASCANVCDGQIVISIGGGSGNYTQIEWFEGTIASPGPSHASGPSLAQSDLCPNTDYFVTVSDDNGCTRSFQLTPISSPPPFNFSESHTDVTCATAGDGFINTTLTGGTPGYTYNWSTTDGSGLTPGAPDQSGLSGGTYSLIYVDNLGCRDSIDVVILEPDPIFTNGILTDVSCFDLTDGSIDVTTTGGNGGYVWTWTSSPNGNIVDPTTEDQTGLDSAVYHLNIVDGLGCTYDTTFNLSKPGELFFAPTITQMDCFGDNDAIIQINPTNGVPSYIIDWNSPLNIPNGPDTQTGLSAGTYNITLTDNNGCDKDTSIVIIQPPLLTLSEVSHTDITCFGFNDGTITLTLSGGTAPTTTVWSGGTTSIPNNTLNPTALGPGTYTAQVTDANGCQDNVVIVIDEPARLSLTITGTDLTCNGVANGDVSIVPSGGTIASDYLYDWDNDPRGDFDDLQNLSSLLAGTYCVNIQDDNGCTLTADSCFTIIEPDSIFFAGSIHTDITCNGDNDGSINLTVTGGTEAGAYGYSWSPTPGCYTGSVIAQNLSGLCPGSYTVTATDDNGCTNDTTFNIIEPLALNISETHIDLGCADANTGEITINVSGGIAPLNVTWTSSTTTTPATNNLNPTGLEPGNYTATVTDANNCTAAVALTITTPAPLSLTITGTDLSCNGVPDGTVSIVPTGGTVAGNYTFDWDIDGRNDFDDNQNLTNLLAGTYCVNIQDDNGCVLAADSCFSISEPDSIFFPGSTFTDMNCFGADNGSINLNITGGVGSYGISWSGPACAGALPGTPNLSGLCDGTYIATVTDDNGCVNDTTFTVTEPIQLVITTSSTDAGCGISNGSVTVNPSGGTVAGNYNISWVAATSSFTGSNLTETGLAPDTYTVTVTDDNGCSVSANEDVQTITPPLVTIDNQTNLLCSGTCIGAVQISISGGTPPYAVQWTGITDPSFSTTSEDIFSLCAGDYSLSVTDANLCQEVQTITITEPAPLELTSTNVTNVDCFGNSTGAINITPAGGTISGNYIFTWTGDNSLSASTEDVSGLLPGTYCVNISDDNGCSMATDSCFTITEPTELLIDNLSSTDAQCNVPNGSVSVTASGGTVGSNYSYSWVSLSNPTPPGNVGTTATVNNVLNDTYTVTVTDDNGCQAVGSVSVQPSNGPAVTVDGFADVTCAGAANGSISTSGSGGTGSLTYSWSTIPASAFSASTPNVSGLSGGTYVVTVTDGALCNSQDVIVINEPNPIVINAAITNANCFGDDGEIDITVTGGTVTGNYGYDWDYNGGASFGDTEDVQLPAGTYNVSVVDDNSCIANGGPYTITEPTQINLTTSSTTSACTQSTGTVSVTATDGTPGNAPNEYTYIWTDGIGNQVGNTSTAFNLPAGCYDVQITENRPNGCIVTTNECISDNPGPTLTFTQVDVTCNGGTDGSVDLTIASTANPVNVVWNSLNGSTILPGTTSEDINGLAADEYSVVATDANGCTSGVSVDIFEPAALSLNAVITSPLCSSTMNGTVDITINDAVLPLNSISWTGPGGFSSSNEDISGLAVGQYCLSVVDANNCQLDTCIILTAPTGITVSTSTVDSDCSSPTGEVSATATGGIPNYTFEWFTDPGMTSSLGLGSSQTGLGAGIYYLQVTDVNGCTGTAQEQVVESNAPTATLDAINHVDCFGNSTGDIFISVTGGTPNYTYDWDNLAGSNNPQDQTGLPQGTYTVTVTDASGCSDVLAATVNEPNAPLSISGTTSDLNCNSIPDGQVTINVTGGTPGFTYTWTQSGNPIATASNNTGVNTVTSLSALTYDVLVTDANGCTITDNFTLNEPTAISLAMANVDASCGNSDGEVSVVATGGTDGITYTYNWIDFNSGLGVGSGNATETGLPQGTYEVTVQDLNGCTMTGLATISDIGGPAVTGTSNDVNCFGDANGTIDITVTGNPNFGFSWVGPNAFTSVLEDINGLEAGNYAVAVTDINGCVTNSTFAVGGPIAPLAVSATVIDLSCNQDLSGAIDITTTGGTSPYLYNWTGPNGFTASFEDISSLEAGTYTVDITDDNGCTLLGSSFIVIEPSPITIVPNVVEPSCGNADGSVTVVVSGGVAVSGYTYVWTDLVSGLMPDTDDDIANIDAGNYQVDVTDDNGCTNTLIISVSNDQAPPVSLAITDVTCFGFNDGTITTTVNGTNTYTFDWDNLAGTNDPQDQTGLAPGIYNLTVEESPTGCISTASATILEPGLLTISGTTSDLACFGDGSGAINVTITGGTTNYNTDWDNLPGTNDPVSQTGLSAGNYQITVTDANGCVAIDAYTLTEPLQISIAGSTTDNLCFGETNGAIDVTVSNGVAPYQHAWDLPSTNEDLTNLAAGTYNLTVTDDNGCTEVASFTINEPSAIIFDATVTDANCNIADGAITTNVSGGTLTSPDYTYDWIFGGSSIASTSSITNQVAGTYTFFVTDDNGCTEDTIVVINNINAPVITVNSTTDVTCFGSSNGAIDVSVTGGTTPYTYLWNPSGIAQTQDLSNAPADTYSIQVTDAVGCISILPGLVINEPAQITASITSNDATCGVCNGTATVVGTGGTGTLSYLWSTSTNIDTESNLCSGIYTVAITDQNGCTVNEDVTINDIGGPTGENIATTDALCAGSLDGTATVSATGGTAPYNYFWPHNGSTNGTQNTLGAGTYNVEMIDNNGCIRVAQVDILEPTPISISSTVTPSTCGNSDGSITITTSGGVSPLSINWTNPSGQTTPGVSGLPAGIYTVVVTDNNGCSVSQNISITDVTAPTLTLSATDALCNGDLTGNITSSVSGAIGTISYQWYDNSPSALAGETNSDLLNAGAGDYILEIVDAGTGCITNGSVTISEPSALILSLPNVIDASCASSCDGEATVIVSGGTLAYTYNWTSGANTATASNLCVGVNTVTITDNNGCVIQSNVTVDENFTLAASVTPTDATCGLCNGQATVAATGGSGSYTINWSNGSTGTSVNNLCSGLYPFEVVDNGSGCSIQLDATINDIGGPTGETINVTDVTCFGGNDGQATVLPSGGTTPYTYSWVGLANNTNSISAQTAGNYTLQVIDNNGCTRNVPVTISEPTPMDVQYIALDGTCGNADGAITLVVTGTATPFTYSWISGPSAVGSVNNSETGLLPGVYTINVTDASGCTETVIVPLGTTSGPDLTTTSQDVSCFGLNNGQATVVATGNAPFNYQWTSGGNIDIETGLSQGSYFVTVTDNLGCVSNASVQIDSPDQLILGIPNTQDASCDIACDGEATIIVSGGSLAYNFLWDGGQTSQTASGLCPGVNNVTITDANGCQVQSSVTIGTNNTLTSSIAETDAACGLCDGEATVTGSGGSGSYSVSWFDGSASSTHPNLCAGIYPFTLMDLGTGCSVDMEATINNIDGPDNETISITDVTCFGGSNGGATVNVSGGTLPYTYLWVPTGQTTNVLSNVPAGTYNLEVSDSNDCKRVVPVTISETTEISVNYISTGSNCGSNDGSFELIISGGATPYTINWSGPGATSGNTAIANNLTAGIYTINITDNNGCSETIMIPISTTNPPSATVSTTNITCFGANDGTASVVGAGLSFEWQDGSTTSSINNLSAGSYFVVATDGITGCSAIFSGTVSSPDSLAMGIQFTQDPLCNGDCNGEISAIVDGGSLPYNYTWSSSPNLGATETGLCDGTIILTVIDINGCSTSQNITLTEPTPIAITIDNIVDAQCVNSGDGSVDITVTGGVSPYTFDWITNPASSFTSNLEDISGLNPGLYELTVTDDNGCISTANAPVDTITVVLANAGVDTAFCFDLCAVLTGSAVSPVPTTFEWNSVPGTTILSTADTLQVCPITAGVSQFTLTVSALNCTHTDTINVELYPLPTVDAGADIEDVLSSTVTLGGNPTGPSGSSYFWTPNTNFVSANDSTTGNPQIELLDELDYYVFVTDSNGCMNSDTIHVRPIPQIVFPNGFTPNGDGINDDWQIDYIDQFPNSVVEVYNRWGEMLFRSVGYTKRWDGRYEGKELPVGTYYYIIELNDPLFPDVYSGPITIMR